MGNLAREPGPRRRHHELLQRGVNAIGANDDVGRCAGAVGEGDDGLLLILLKADASVAGVDDGRRELIYEERKQVGAVEAVELDSACLVGGPHRGGESSVRSEVLGIDPAGAVAGDAIAESQCLQHAHAVRLDGDAGADL